MRIRLIMPFCVAFILTITFTSVYSQTRPKNYYRDTIHFENAPRRLNNKYPLSDQKNSGSWVLDKVHSDEFNAKKLNEERWFPNNPSWKGRQPTQFHASNVSLNKGNAEFRINQHGDDKLLPGYTHTSGFIVSKQKFLYGYFEARLKINDSPWVGGYWMCNHERHWWTEIDMCENCPGNPERRNELCFNVHVFHSPKDQGDVKKHFDKPVKFYIPFELQKDFHVWGMDWNKDFITIYMDGVEYYKIENTHWHQALRVNFNNESNKWFGALPNGEGEDEVYLVDYFRVWQKSNK